MTIEEAVERFGTAYKLCKALGIRQQNFTRWAQQGYIPMVQQFHIAQLTEGELMPDDIDPKKLKRLMVSDD